jgi:hypothetical protein
MILVRAWLADVVLVDLVERAEAPRIAGAAVTSASHWYWDPAAVLGGPAYRGLRHFPRFIQNIVSN